MIAHFGNTLTTGEALLYLCASVGAAVLLCLFLIAVVFGGLLLWDSVSCRRSGLTPRFPKGRNR